MEVREGSIGVKATRRRGTVRRNRTVWAGWEKPHIPVRLWDETVGAGVVGAIWVEAQHLEA